MDISGEISSGYNDDGEWKASQLLVNLLDQKNIAHGILVVTRKYGGVKLGRGLISSNRLQQRFCARTRTLYQQSVI